MNIFFYVEDAKSGREMFEFIIKNTLDRHRRVRSLADVTQFCYVIESGFGYPSMAGIRRDTGEKNRLGVIIDEINKNGNIDMLVVCLDSDGNSAPKAALIRRHIKQYVNKLRCPYRIFTQDICVETWLLGIDTLFPSVFSGAFESYAFHYNVSKHDPELMDKPPGYRHTASCFHYDYLREMAKCHSITVSKSNCRALFRKHYLKRLIHRIDYTEHLSSLRSFMSFLWDCR